MYLKLEGSDPQDRSHTSFASFHDPDGGGWQLPRTTERLPGRE
jgi:hypothetical protein